ncbi:MAG: FG-GAP-like repeat-containing protein [Pyrinomonadaceae bacterium]|nr:FG-GAP-like repeat-containing protein [Pyrinomonadaceae bacterium]
MSRSANKIGRFSFIFFAIGVFIVSSAFEATAQKVRLRSQLTPNCTVVSGTQTWKFSDIYADGNIAVQGSYNCRGVFIYDISNPDAPVLASWYNPSPNQQFLEAIVVGNRGYFGSGSNTTGVGVHIVDLSDPYNPVLLGVVDPNSGNGYRGIHEMVVWGDYLIENSNFNSAQRNIRIINISNPASPVFVRDITPADTVFIHAMFVRHNRLYLSGWGGRTEIWDISNVATQTPVSLGSILGSGAGNTQNHSTWNYDGIIYANSDQKITNATSSAEFTFQPGQGETSTAERRFGLVTHRTTEFPDFPFSFLVKKNGSGVFTGEVVERNSSKATFTPAVGDVLKISIEAGTVKYFRNSELLYTSQTPLPTQSGSPNLLAKPLLVNGVLFHKNTTISSAKIDSASIVWKSPDNQIFISGNTISKASGCDDCNYLYSCREAADANDVNSGDLRVIDVVNPASPFIVRTIRTTQLGLNAITPHNPVVLGNKLYIAWYQAGTQVFDLSNPTDPKRVGQYDTYQPQFTALENPFTTSEEPWDVACGLSDFANAIPTNYNGNWTVFPLLGEDKVIAADMNSGLLILDTRNSNAPAKNNVSDFDGDGKTDFSVFTPSNGNWSIESSGNNAFSSTPFGTSEDRIAAGDYDGDGKADYAVFRASAGSWYILGSSSGFRAVNWGSSGDIPVAADYDADGKTDVAVFRPSNGVWYILQSTLGFKAVGWGTAGDKPVVGDFEGDGKPDQAVYRNGVWYVLQSSSSIPLFVSFGTATDKPLVGDYDGDSKTDYAVYRASEGYWYILNSTNNSLSILGFGLSDDIPVPADYDGDGKTDVSVFRPGANAWYRLNSSNGAFASKTFGQTGDRPSPASVQAQ